jgi:hypothetical protein
MFTTRKALLLQHIKHHTRTCKGKDRMSSKVIMVDFRLIQAHVPVCNQMDFSQAQFFVLENELQTCLTVQQMLHWNLQEGRANHQKHGCKKAPPLSIHNQLIHFGSI